MKPEILSPAGDLEKLKTAFAYGADACYMGVKSMSMRVKQNEIGQDELREALRLKNELGKKLYVTMNIHAHETRLSFLDKEIDYLNELHEEGLEPDAVLVSDVGVIMILQQKCPWLDIHISTQANILNSAGIEFWAKQPNVTRVVLGREASLREIKKIRQELNEKGIEIELEAFVHGAMCMAYSGRCLLSSFMSNRDANEGMCSHSCRWNYKIHEGKPQPSEKKEYYMEEEQRKGEFYAIEEDEFGTYMMSSKDMCMIEHLQDVLDAGIDSLKIEGRHKSIFYAAISAHAYRQALDLAMDGKPVTPEIIDIIETVNTRGYFTGFWYGKPGEEGQKYNDSRGDYNSSYCFAGVIRRVEGDVAHMEVRNTLKKGDELEIISPTSKIPITLSNFKSSKTGEEIEKASGGQKFSIAFKAPASVEEGWIVRKKLKPNVKSNLKVHINKEKKCACSKEKVT